MAQSGEGERGEARKRRRCLSGSVPHFAMKLMGNCSGNCTYDYSDFSRDNGLDDDGGGEGECCGGGPVVVVGVKLDSRSRELLTWALVKIAQSGDRVIALHVIDPNTGMPSLICRIISTLEFVYM